MSPADRVALTERLARAAAWTALPEHERATLLRTSEALVTELATTRGQIDRIGWLFVDITDPADPELVE